MFDGQKGKTVQVHMCKLFIVENVPNHGLITTGKDSGVLKS